MKFPLPFLFSGLALLFHICGSSPVYSNSLGGVFSTRQAEISKSLPNRRLLAKNVAPIEARFHFQRYKTNATNKQKLLGMSTGKDSYQLNSLITERKGTSGIRTIIRSNSFQMFPHVGQIFQGLPTSRSPSNETYHNKYYDDPHDGYMEESPMATELPHEGGLSLDECGTGFVECKGDRACMNKSELECAPNDDVCLCVPLTPAICESNAECGQGEACFRFNPEEQSECTSKAVIGELTS